MLVPASDPQSEQQDAWSSLCNRVEASEQRLSPTGHGFPDADTSTVRQSRPCPNPTFRIVRKSIRLIPRGIAQDSLCGYWEHADQFVGPALDRGGVWQLVEG